MSVFDTKPWLSAYAPGVPQSVQLPTDSLVDMMDAAVTRYRSAIALDFFGATTSYSRLGDEISRVASGLRKLGVTAGDRVALVLPNCPQHIVAFYAVLRLGAIVVEHNPLYTPRELRHQFEDHGARVAIVWDKLVDTVVAFPKDIAVRTVVSVDLTRAMPASKRFALRLPIRKARDARAALTSARLSTGATSWQSLLGARPLRRSFPRPAPATPLCCSTRVAQPGHPRAPSSPISTCG